VAETVSIASRIRLDLDGVPSALVCGDVTHTRRIFEPPFLVRPDARRREALLDETRVIEKPC
jgi:hypothetical protein